MVKFKLISIDNGNYYYEVYPEGNKEDKGYIVFNPELGEVKERVVPSAGEKYLNHAISGFTDAEGNFKKEGMVAWY